MKAALILVDIQKDYFPGGRMELVRIIDASRNAKTPPQQFSKHKTS